MQLSIVVPVYNVAKYLRKCLDSIFDQTIKDFEIICVDDGSTDNSPEILNEYKLKHNNIKIITQTNHGLGYARNVGIDHASGEYVAFVDSDDFIAKDMFADMVDYISKNKADVCVSNPFIYDNSTGLTQPYRSMLDFYRLSLIGGFKAIDHPKVFSFIGAWDKLYRRDYIIANNIKFPVNRIYEDALFTYQSLAMAKTVCVVKDSYYYYRKNTGISITDKEKQNDVYKEDFLKNAFEIKAFLKEQGIYDNVASEFLKYVCHDGMFHHSNSTSKAFFKKYFYSMRDLFDDADYDLIQKTGIKKYIWYVSVLKDNKLKECPRKLTAMIALPDNDLDKQKYTF